MRHLEVALAGVLVAASSVHAQSKKLDMPLGDEKPAEAPKGRRILTFHYQPGTDSAAERTLTVEKVGHEYQVTVGLGRDQKDAVTTTLAPNEVQALEADLAHANKHPQTLPHDEKARPELGHFTLELPGRERAQGNYYTNDEQPTLVSRTDPNATRPPAQDLLNLFGHVLADSKFAKLQPKPRVVAKLTIDGHAVEIVRAPNGHAGEEWRVVSGRHSMTLSEDDGVRLEKELANARGTVEKLPQDKEHWGANGPFAAPSHFQLSVEGARLQGNVQFNESGVPSFGAQAQEESTTLRQIVEDLHALGERARAAAPSETHGVAGALGAIK